MKRINWVQYDVVNDKFYLVEEDGTTYGMYVDDSTVGEPLIRLVKEKRHGLPD